MHKRETNHRGIAQLIRWLAPANCLHCRCQHNRPRAICVDCEVAFSRNQRACSRCALPLQPTYSQVVSGSSISRVSVRRLCQTCIKDPPHFSGAHAPYLMRTGMRDLIHLWKFQNRPQLTGLLAELLLRRSPAVAAESLTYPRAAAHTVLAPIPTQWRRQVRRGFDHTWLLSYAIQSQWVQPAVVRFWLKKSSLPACPASTEQQKPARRYTRSIHRPPCDRRPPHSAD